MNPSLQCWKCGAALDGLPLPFSRRAECPACRTDLHVCRMCAFYDPRAARACREPVAEDVGDKTRANFCGYFQPRAPEPRRAEASRAGLDALFGTESPPSASPDQTRARLDELFGK